jgi:hypothetical protein
MKPWVWAIAAFVIFLVMISTTRNSMYQKLAQLTFSDGTGVEFGKSDDGKFQLKTK